MSERCPRVNGETIGKYKAQTVTIVGCKLDAESDPMTIKTTDNKTISVYKNAMLKPERFDSKWFEITGKVTANESIEEENTTPIPGEIDTEAWNHLARIWNKYDGEVF